MVKSAKAPGEPRRGHGGGKAATPEAEEARKMKIQAARIEASKKVLVVVEAGYRKKGASVDKQRPSEAR